MEDEDTAARNYDPRRDEHCQQIARGGFTLVELLVVIVIILVVSAVALPTVVSAISHRSASEGARLVSAALAGARDAAIRDNAPAGLRLIPDPLFSGISPTAGRRDPLLPLAFNRLVPLVHTAAAYTDGLILQHAGPLPAAVGALAYTGPATPAVTAPTWANTSA